jgi:hypothetical protein
VDSHFDVGDNHPPHCDNFMMMVSADDLSMVGTNTIVFDYPIHYGTQTLATDGKHILFGNYGAKRTQGNTAGLCFSRATTGMELLDSHSFYVSEGFCLVPKSVSGRDTPVFLKVVALGGNMQGWRKDPKNNPPRLRFDFYAYDVATGVMTNITDYSGARGAELALFRHRCAAAGQKGAICIGQATSMEKIRPRDGTLPKVATGISLRLARGEKESAQLFVTPRNGDLRNVRVAIEDGLKYGDAAIETSNIAISVLGYVNVTNTPPYKTGRNVATANAPGYVRKSFPAELGWWPDPILSYLDHTDVHGDDVQGFWIRVRAPENQKPGLYEGRIIVTADGADSVTVPITVRVNDFVVPKSPMLPLAVPFQGISTQKRINSRAQEDKMSPHNLWKRHEYEWLRFMSDHYVTWGGIYAQRPNFEMLERQRPLGVEGMFNLGTWNPPNSITNESDMAAWRKKTLPRLQESYEKAKARGIADKAFVYGCDELKWEWFDRIEWAAAEIKKALPGVPIMTTARDYGFGESGKLKSIDCFVSQTEKYSLAKAAAARKRGQKVWWYFACDQHAPYANCFIEGQGIEMRSVMGAQAVKFRPDGFLYYWIGSNCSSRPAGDNPFTDCEPRTWPSEYHGDGGWLSCGPDGIPLSTIRFENFADGLEDYAYAKLLEEKLRAVESKKLKAESAGGDNWIRRAKKALAVPDTVVQSVRNYTDDPAVIYRWRDEMADLIEECP